MSTVLSGNGSGGSGTPGDGSGQGGSGTPGSGGQNAGGSGAGTQGGTGQDGGGAAATWRDSLPADLKTSASLGRYSSVENLAKGYLNLEQNLGKKGHILPTDKSLPEDWNALYDALGRPPADKFEIKLPEDGKVDTDFVGWFKQAAHKAGLLPKQAQEIFDGYRQQAQGTREAQIQAAKVEGEKQLGELKQSYGKEWDGAVKRAVRAADHVSPEFRQYLEKTGLGNDVQIIKALDKLGKLLGEDKMRGDGSGNMGTSPDQIDAEIAQIRNTPEFVSFQDSPKKRQLNDRLAQLYQLKHSA